MELAKAIGDALEDILYMLTFSIINGLIILALFYFVINILPHIIRFVTPILSPPLSRVSSAVSKLKRPRSYTLAMQPIGPVPSDTYHTAFLLAQVMPVDLVPTVLDMAGFWLDAPLASTTHPFQVVERTAGSEYLMAELPETFPGKALRTLTFTVTSKDQGYSWDNHFHGTYLNSWTWFEVVIFSPESGRATEPNRARTPISRRKIITNVHAGREYKTHTVRWSHNDRDEEIRKLMRSIRGGMRIAITVWARYPAWVNDVRSARIDCQVNAVRKM
ncbi:hypothetical protein A1O3_00549 [Capronia epimyces CBS 606.96]|uniref:Uncharacterized protein n=1 Tax=Capronia epimyces CBS 606.96 TaxID=1182542 RepID=W9ZBW4_9EURO|nr:uncharacterized protein A1O3_00549 [Capronia epimyces CBS 606.96]EXJ91999.1 hypothetical protein A1O3_00549 [Capronia epimyces CBS 606.96]